MSSGCLLELCVLGKWFFLPFFFNVFFKNNLFIFSLHLPKWQIKKFLFNRALRTHFSFLTLLADQWWLFDSPFSRKPVALASTEGKWHDVTRPCALLTYKARRDRAILTWQFWPKSNCVHLLANFYEMCTTCLAGMKINAQVIIDHRN